MEAVAARIEEEQRPTSLPLNVNLECSSCGYGIARSTPPERCPMCQAVDGWVHTPWRPFSRGGLSY